MRTNETQPMLRGDRYRSTHQASVDAVLGAGTRQVFSRGSRFYNKDRWPLRTFVVHFCAWVSTHKSGTPPTLAEVAVMCDKANGEQVHGPHIVIASTPEELTLPVALALVGGAYHEAWHTKYSKRGNVNPREMKAIIDQVWSRVADWSKMSRAILEWSNVVEDIRIERNGCQEFPGAEVKMHDLQGFILDQEEDARNKALAMGTPEAMLNRTQAIVSATFRDVGLGYNTERQRRAFDAYVERNGEAVKFVLEGPLSDLLRETIRLGARDDTACLRIAMEVLATILETSQNKDEQEQDGQDGDGAGAQGQAACPNCGSPNVKIRKTGKGKGVLVCGRCGYEEEIDLPESGKGKGKGQSAEMEGDDSEGSDEGDGSDEGEGSGKGKKSDKKDAKKGKGKAKSSEKSDSDEEGEEQGDGSGSDEEGEDEGSEGEEQGESDGEGSEGEGDEDGESEGQGSDGDEDGESDADGEGKGDEAGEEGSDSEQDGEGSEGTDEDGEPELRDDEGDGGEGGGKGAGGHHYEEQPKGWDVVAAGYLEDADTENGLMDASTALEEAFDGEKADETEDCKRGEQPYQPYDRTKDTVEPVGPSHRGQADDERRAQELLESVRSECSVLRARLRQIIRSVEQTSIEHGVRRGRGLSQRMFVDDRVALMAGRTPSRPDFDIEDQIDTKMAAVVVTDESGSMCSRLQLAAQAMLALVEPLDALGYPTMAVGFRDGNYSGSGDGQDKGTYFRYASSHIDVFKAFGESFRAIKWRFANTMATGGTPMADGVQFGLEALQTRTETHRVMFVITDGQPDYNHVPVMRRQLRLAHEAGILVVGVGIGSGAEYVKRVFPEFVYVERLADLPMALIKKLNDLLDFRGLRGGSNRRSALPTAG